MKRDAIILLAVIMLLLVSRNAMAQSDETKKFEVGAQFSLLNIERVGGRVTEPGVGGRFTYNLTENLALEAEMNFFPKPYNGASNLDGGRITEGLFGIKAGKRFDKFGLFGKFRPGFVSFDRAIIGPRDARVTTNDPLNPLGFQYGRLTHRATDVGGVFEFYPSKRAAIRFDLGDTMIHYGSQTFINAFGQPVTFSSFTRHNLQFSAGVGLRF